MTGGKLRVEVSQVGDESIPTAWDRFIYGGFAGNPYAWLAEVDKVGRDEWPIVIAYGYTREGAISKAVNKAREQQRRIARLEGTKEVFYVD